MNKCEMCGERSHVDGCLWNMKLLLDDARDSLKKTRDELYTIAEMLACALAMNDADKPKFNKKDYMREYMRKRRQR